jgi:uncharacterized UBP type Zn finger protein
MEVEENEDFDQEDDGEDDDNDSENRNSDAERDSDIEREEEAHMNELRRQALVESLLGMGFPADWALRAADHCDGVSESAAIAWIIERMENEQRIDSDNDSRLYCACLLLISH